MKINNIQEKQILICFADLTNFRNTVSKYTSIELFEYISEVQKITTDIIKEHKGFVLKNNADETLMIFDENQIDNGVIGLLKLKKYLDEFNRKNKLESVVRIKCHYGIVAVGYMTVNEQSRLDIMGNEVNICATLKSNGFSMTAETFRKLSPETRKYFKKHTPPISYIPVEEWHKD